MNRTLPGFALFVAMGALIPAQTGSRGQAWGMEFAAAVNLPQKDMRAIGLLYLPEKIRHVRAVIVVFRWGAGAAFYPDPGARKLSESTDSGLLLVDFPTMKGDTNYSPRDAIVAGADGLILLLQRLAQESGHQELASAPFLFWGHSAFGSFGPSSAALYPERTIAFVQYQAGLNWLATLVADGKVPRYIPALFLADGKDTRVPPANIQGFFKGGRSAGSPWTFAVDVDASHGGGVGKANELMIPWITAVLRQRLQPDGRSLRPVADNAAWLGNIPTADVAPYGMFSGSKAEASWLPDEASVGGWRAVHGTPR